MKKINTYPGGSFILAINIPIIVMVLMGIFLIPQPISIGIFLFALLTLFIESLYIKKGFCNFLYFNEQGIKHKNCFIDWNTVRLTVSYTPPTIFISSFVQYLYFSDHYLSRKEIESKQIQKDKCFIVLTPKRAQWLLQNYPYNKQIAVVAQRPIKSERFKRINQIIEMHNQNKIV